MVKLRILILLCGLLVMLSCAQMGPPIPPSLELPKTVSDLKAVRKADKVYLRWTVPSQTTDGERVEHLGDTNICRSFDEKAAKCEQVGKLPPTQAQATRTEASFTDTLPSWSLDAGKVFSYSVSVDNESEKSAGLSNRVAVSAAPTLLPPANFKASVTADGVVLSWTTTTTADSGVWHFYRIYRRLEGTESDLVAGELPVDATTSSFVDHGFEWDKTYLYRMTVVTEVSGGMHPCGTTAQPQPDCATVYRMEGDDTPTIKVVAEDVFPPVVPSGLQAVYSGEGQKAFVDLLWVPGTESDLAGYNVYRHEQDGPPTRLNSEPVKLSAYRDPAVQSGTKYFYFITAVDLRGNESGRSDEASEQVP